MSHIEDRISELTGKCVGCGTCTTYCPSARHGGCDPCGIMIAGGGDISDCIACGNCSKVCGVTDPLTVMKSLIYLERRDRFPDHFERTGYIHPMEDCPSRTELDPKWDPDGINIMPGCVVKAKVPYLEHATAVALRHLGYGCKELEGNCCCMRPAQFIGMSDDDRFRFKGRAMENAGGREVLALCHGCSEEMNASSFDVDNIIRFFHGNMDGLPILAHTLRVAIEPGCQAEEFFGEMKDIVEAMGCEVTNDRMGCCGKDTRVNPPLMGERMEECSDADVIIAACPKCFTKYDTYPGGKPVLYLAELVAVASGDRSTLKYHKTHVGPDII